MSGTPRPGFEHRKADWLDVAEASSRTLSAVPPPETERVPLVEALGRALLEDAVATATLPPWDNSAMDGYAVRADDVTGASPEAPVVLRVVGSVRAGESPGAAVSGGEAVRIMTGAPIPSGADSVVRVEDTDCEGTPGSVRIFQDRDGNRHVRPGGQDMRPGERMLARGHPIGPGSVGVLAALGMRDVAVGRRPTVAILTTGDELRGPDRYHDVRSGQGVPDSNGPMLAAAVVAAGGTPLPMEAGSDDAPTLRHRMASASGADVLVTVGGASMGEADLVKTALDTAGFRLDFWRVKMRPGSPFSFGWLPGANGLQPVFGLPGNPASAFVTFEVFARPFLLKMAGHRLIHRTRIRCVAGDELRGVDGSTVFARVALSHEDGRFVVRSTGPQSSGLVRGLAAARALALIPGEAPYVPRGGTVDALALGEVSGGQAASPWGTADR